MGAASVKAEADLVVTIAGDPCHFNHPRGSRRRNVQTWRPSERCWIWLCQILLSVRVSFEQAVRWTLS
jgi:hypothetical protein